MILKTGFQICQGELKHIILQVWMYSYYSVECVCCREIVIILVKIERQEVSIFSALQSIQDLTLVCLNMWVLQAAYKYFQNTGLHEKSVLPFTSSLLFSPFHLWSRKYRQTAYHQLTRLLWISSCSLGNTGKQLTTI